MSDGRPDNRLGKGLIVTGDGFPSLAHRPDLYPGIRETLEDPAEIDPWPPNYFLHRDTMWPITGSPGQGPGEASIGTPEQAGFGSLPRLSQLLAELRLPGLAGRIPIVAVGSNAYPRQLFDKLTGAGLEAAVPAFRGLLSNAKIAYCPRLASKGYVPVTPTYSQGEKSVAWLQFLTPEQAEVIVNSERPYLALACRRGSGGLSFRADEAGFVPDEVLLFWHSRVLAADDGEPVLCRSTLASGYSPSALSQRALLRSIDAGAGDIDALLRSRAAANPGPPWSRPAEGELPVYQGR